MNGWLTLCKNPCLHGDGTVGRLPPILIKAATVCLGAGCYSRHEHDQWHRAMICKHRLACLSVCSNNLHSHLLRFSELGVSLLQSTLTRSSQPVHSFAPSASHPSCELRSATSRKDEMWSDSWLGEKDNRDPSPYHVPLYFSLFFYVCFFCSWLMLL